MLWLWIIVTTIGYLMGIVAVAKIGVGLMWMDGDPLKWDASEIVACVLWPGTGVLLLLYGAIAGGALGIAHIWLWTMKHAIKPSKPKPKPHRPMVLCDVCRKEMPQKGPLS